MVQDGERPEALLPRAVLPFLTAGTVERDGDSSYTTGRCYRTTQPLPEADPLTMRRFCEIGMARRATRTLSRASCRPGASSINPGSTKSVVWAAGTFPHGPSSPRHAGERGFVLHTLLIGMREERCRGSVQL
jgi:hypothetical protein